MQVRWQLALVAGLGLLATDPALARAHHKAARCIDRPAPFTWHGFFFNGKPQPNGCAPAVIEYGEYVGQDPDPNVRNQLRRDPNNGYTTNQP